MASGRSVFLDTSFFIALSFKNDASHAEAARLWQETQSLPLLTSTAVLGETWTFLRSRLDFGVALNLISSIESEQRLRTVHIDQSLNESAWEWIKSRGERSYSYVDATSFALMRREGVLRALTFDRDFEIAGFVLYV